MKNTIHYSLMSIVLMLSTFTFAQTIYVKPVVTELRVTRSDTGESKLFNSTMDEAQARAFGIPTNSDAAKAKATEWYNLCKCVVYVRHSYNFNGRLLLSTSASSSAVAVSSSSSSSKSSSSSSSKSSSSFSQSSSQSSLSRPILSWYAPTERVLPDPEGNPVPLALEELKEYEVWYSDTDFDVVPSTSYYMEHPVSIILTSGQSYRIYARDNGELTSAAAYVEVI
jgi:hypothetical protein